MIFDRHWLLVGTYISVLFFAGIGYLAILPPLEGFDEAAHYASIRQIADTGRLPLYGASFLDQETVHYSGPSHYNEGPPPFDQGLTYKKFFAHPDLEEEYATRYRHAESASEFVPSTTDNWQSQHPPLYYGVLAPLERATEKLSLVTRFFVLRLASFVIALGGVVMGMAAIRPKGQPRLQASGVLGFLVYPIVFPGFLPEFTRIGNDSLCLFLTGLSALLLSKLLLNPSNKKTSLALGIALGAGLLTKAFFIPIGVSLAVLLAVRAYGGSKKNRRSDSAISLASVFGAALIIGAGWYVYKLYQFGDFLGSDDLIRLQEQGGLLLGLQQNFSVSTLVTGLFETIMSYIWSGSWSLTAFPVVAQLPVLILAIWSLEKFAKDVRTRPFSDPAWLVVWLAATFGAGLFYHALACIAWSGMAQTPGWYLHILMPWVAPALGTGLTALFRHPKSRFFTFGLLGYAFVFQLMTFWAQFTLFTGCAVKGKDATFAFETNAFCLDILPVLMTRLSILGYPKLAEIGFSLAALCLVVLIWVCRSETKKSGSECI